MALRIIILLLLVVPALEIWGLITVGGWIGPWPTVLLVIATGVVGGYLAKWQGLQALRLAQIQLRNNDLPGEAILDGICILCGGLLLLAPGFFTDVAGLVLLIPFTRGMMKHIIKKNLTRMMQSGTIVWISRR